MAVIIASDGAWELLWQIIGAADYAAADPEERGGWYSEPVVLPAGWTGDPIDADEKPLPPLYARWSGRDHSRLAHAVASVAGPAAPAPMMAGRVLDAASLLGLEDNATAAAAVMSAAS